MNQKEHKRFQVKSILIVRYISEFCVFEKLIIEKFRQEILNVNHNRKNKLYFYYGVHVGHKVYYDFDRNRVSLSEENKYDENEMFKSLNLNKIIKFERKEKLIDSFNFTIDSLVRKVTTFDFYDCCLRIISMRNKLAHEVDSISFCDKDIIETLPDEYLKGYNYQFIEDYDIGDMDDDSKALLCNIIYIRKIINKLTLEVNQVI